MPCVNTPNLHFIEGHINNFLFFTHSSNKNLKADLVQIQVQFSVDFANPLVLLLQQVLHMIFKSQIFN